MTVGLRMVDGALIPFYEIVTNTTEEPGPVFAGWESEYRSGLASLDGE